LQQQQLFNFEKTITFYSFDRNKIQLLLVSSLYEQPIPKYEYNDHHRYGVLYLLLLLLFEYQRGKGSYI